MLLRELSECIQHITVYQAEIARIDRKRKIRQKIKAPVEKFGCHPLKE